MSSHSTLFLCEEFFSFTALIFIQSTQFAKNSCSWVEFEAEHFHMHPYEIEDTVLFQVSPENIVRMKVRQAGYFWRTSCGEFGNVVKHWVFDISSKSNVKLVENGDLKTIIVLVNSDMQHRVFISHWFVTKDYVSLYRWRQLRTASTVNFWNLEIDKNW